MGNNRTTASLRDRRVLNATKDIVTPTQAAAAAGVTIVSTTVGAGGRFKTKLTIADFTQATANANLEFGKLIFTFPEGKVAVHSVKMKTTIYGTNQVLTPEIALGSTLAAGVFATLNAATEYDLLPIQTGTAITTTPGSITTISKAGTGSVLDGSAGAKAIYLNFAGAFTDVDVLHISAQYVDITWSLSGDE